jgi:arylsulfatase A-like enzyme
MRIPSPVSSRRIFHTIMESADINAPQVSEEQDAENKALSLMQNVNGKQPERENVFTEAFSPLTLVKLIENKNPDLVEQFRCLATRRAIYKGTKKLVTVDDKAEELYDIAQDPEEIENRISDQPELAEELYGRLQNNLASARSRHANNGNDRQKVNLEDEPEVAERLRQLGYIE